MNVVLTHSTKYRYSHDVCLGPQIVKLHPAPHCRTSIADYKLEISPNPKNIEWLSDDFSNKTAKVTFDGKTNHLEIHVTIAAKLAPINPFDFFLDPSAVHHPFSYEASLKTELSQYLTTSETGPLFKAFVEKIPKERRRSIEYIVYLNQLVFNRIRYLVRYEPGVQTAEQTLELGYGSCRDSTWLLVQLFRSLGIAARFVSGYLIEVKPEWHNLNSPQNSQEQVAELHAWCEAFIPGAGWIGLDPTSGLLATEGHIPLAVAPSPQDAMPIYGELDVCDVELTHQITTSAISS